MSFVELLSGGDRRSIGWSAEAVARVMADPERLGELIAAMLHPDPRVAMRAADAAEKVSAAHPAWLRPHKRVLLTRIAARSQQEVRWHCAQMIPRLALTPRERLAAFEWCASWLADPSRIVQVCALQALADLARQDAALAARACVLIEAGAMGGSPALRARAKALLRAPRHAQS